MPHLELQGNKIEIPQGESFIGTDEACAVRLSGAGVAPRHAIVQGLPDGQVAVRLAQEGLEARVNGVALGPQPNPLLHGDKLQIADSELLFVDESKGGSTQYVKALDPSMQAPGRGAASGSAKPTAATGGRLVSLTDGKEYTVESSGISIGREASNSVVVLNKNVSRKHAEILPTPEGYVIVDSSTNGTFINSQRVAGQQVLSRGDVIKIGDDEFRFYADRVSAQAPPGQPSASPSAAAPPPASPAPPSAPQPTPESSSPPTPPAPPPGAEHRLGNTMHGIPGVQRPGTPPTGGPGARQPARAPGPGAAPRPTGAASGGPTVLANLLVKSGSLQGQKLPIKVPIVNVGRAEYNDLMIPDDSISTIHAKLQRREGLWVLVDMGSTNGTFVDGEKVEGEAILAPGAVVRFGEVKTFFEPVDDTIDPARGSSTKVMGAIKFPDPPSQGQGGA